MKVLLFERATFLVISHTERRMHRDPHRFEKVSNIIKQFKLSCRSGIPGIPVVPGIPRSLSFLPFLGPTTSPRWLISCFVLFCFFFVVGCGSKLAAQFQSMEVRNSNFAAFIDVFTSNTYVMVVTSDSTIRESCSSSVSLNLLRFRLDRNRTLC